MVGAVNAVILCVAGVMLTWHNVWDGCGHGSELSVAGIGAQAGPCVGSRARNRLLALASWSAFAVLRDGVKVVLFPVRVISAKGDSLAGTWRWAALLDCCSAPCLLLTYFAGLLLRNPGALVFRHHERY